MRSGVIARTIVLDKLVNAFLAAHPGAIVVNIACGLDTRCYRMAGFSHWYNLDLPETIAVRKKLLPESGGLSFQEKVGNDFLLFVWLRVLGRILRIVLPEKLV